MKIYNLGRALVLTGIVELILASLFYSDKRVILSVLLGDYSYFCLLIGVIVIAVHGAITKN
ncbi:MAG: hypothetical protein QXY87_06595 [Saccharolobus sp.]|uniref:Uncharacterized protein n=2 Tax=Saccharolobus shibatae TaxID=2286 RepID=A0A8F5GYZ6_9CREN|nr:hypothetical protein [Saccharolobus shibatae]MCH4815364.1 hypothetical protein [Saccharolobus shibatae]QXJ28256.1 hypothetical protein J5U23_01124 [Saccharolobus shibatae B12]QXJ31587.1 hypothetical protein J5U21_01237 [Saccharolobus shibatae]QXJ34605.1 hypothetical protein J5U22_01151 [Saccharolobus shibatae]